MATGSGCDSTDSNKNDPSTKGNIGPFLSYMLNPHPRCVATSSDFQWILDNLSKDSLLEQGHQALLDRSDSILTESVAEYMLPDGIRLLEVSRAVLKRMIHWGYAYRCTSDIKYLNRAWEEIQAVSAFPDWNPSHFLDVAEMAMALGIAYDWFYEGWTEAQKEEIRHCLIEKALALTYEAYQGTWAEGVPWWAESTNNWNVVCNGGIAAAALAIGLDAPEYTEKLEYVVETAIGKLKTYMMPQFAPDGGWIEGPMYWGYMIQYFTFLIKTLQSSLGTDMGLLSMPGIEATGAFPIYLTGPSGYYFNYGDCDLSVSRNPELIFLGQYFENPLYSWAQIQLAQAYVFPLDLLYCEALPLQQTIPAETDLDKLFSNVGVITMRETWLHDDGLFVGLKGGRNSESHGDLDLGSFVLDVYGLRWVEDIGKEYYNLEGYWSYGENGERWTYFRKRAESHNTLVIDPDSNADQYPLATSSVQSHRLNQDDPFAVLNLDSAYPEVSSVRRGFRLFNKRQHLLLQDEIEPRTTHEIWWKIVTKATITLSADKRRATLSYEDNHISIHLLTPLDATFLIRDMIPLDTSPNPSEQTDNSEYTSLCIHLKDQSVSTRIGVYFVPYMGTEPVVTPPAPTSLDSWGN